MAEDDQPQHFALRDIYIRLLIAIPIFFLCLTAIQAIIGPAATYGGNVCNDTADIADYCGVPPVGLIFAGGIAVFAASAIARRIKRTVDQIANEHGSVACRLLGHNWDLEPPWSGKELRARPHCERCGHEPADIAITGSHTGDDRV